MSIQRKSVCYSFNSMTKEKVTMQLQENFVKGGYVSKYANSSYINPDTIKLTKNETLVLKDENLPTENWEKVAHYIGIKLRSKNNDNIQEIEIKELGDTPANYPDYTTKQPKNLIYQFYYTFDKSKDEWVFNFNKVLTDVKSGISAKGVETNYTILSQHNRDNIYSGSPADDEYPEYLKGKIGIENIAKLNNVFQILIKKFQKIVEESPQTNELIYPELLNMLEHIEFPTEDEIIKVFKDSALTIKELVDQKIVKFKKLIKQYT